LSTSTASLQKFSIGFILGKSDEFLLIFCNRECEGDLVFRNSYFEFLNFGMGQTGPALNCLKTHPFNSLPFDQREGRTGVLVCRNRSLKSGQFSLPCWQERVTDASAEVGLGQNLNVVKGIRV